MASDWNPVSTAHQTSGLASPAKLSSTTKPLLSHSESNWFGRPRANSHTGSPESIRTSHPFANVKAELLSPFNDDSKPFFAPLTNQTPPASSPTSNKVHGLFGTPSDALAHALDQSARIALPTPPSAVPFSIQERSTPDCCPPPVLLGADSVPRFPTPDSRYFSPVSAQSDVLFPTAASALLSGFRTPSDLSPAFLNNESPTSPSQIPPHEDQDRAEATPEHRGRQAEKDGGRKSVFSGFGARLRSKSTSGKAVSAQSSRERKPSRPMATETDMPALTNEEVMQPVKRERRQSLSEKLSSVLRRKKTETAVPPLPTSRSAACVSPYSLAGSSTLLDSQPNLPFGFISPQSSNLKPTNSSRLSRSISSPNLSGKDYMYQPSKMQLPPLPSVLTQTPFTPPQSMVSAKGAISPAQTDNHFDLRLDTALASVPLLTSSGRSSPHSSLPSLSRSSSQSLSLCETSASGLVTPQLPLSATAWSAFEQQTRSDSRNVENLSFSTLPSSLETGSSVDQAQLDHLWNFLPTSTSQTIPVQGSIKTSKCSPARSDCPAPFQLTSVLTDKTNTIKPAFNFVSLEMSKKPLKKNHKSNPDLAALARKRASSPPPLLLGHSLLPQTDESVKKRSRNGPTLNLPPFVSDSVLSIDE